MKIKLEELTVHSFVTSLKEKGRTINGGIDFEDIDAETVAEHTEKGPCITTILTKYTNRTIHTKCVEGNCNC